MSSIYRLSISTFLLLSLTNCSDIQLDKLDSQEVNVLSKGVFRVDPPNEIERPIKFLFVVDKSGSNNTNDPGAEKRHTNIMSFYQDNKEQENYYWGLHVYVGGTPRAYIENPYFTNNEDEVTSAIDRLQSSDNGGTPYGSVLSFVRAAIVQDQLINTDENAVYMIFFVSDGRPTDNSNLASLRSNINQILDLDRGSIFLSTAYYGPPDAVAENRLEEMANYGEGKYVNFNSTDTLDFNELLVLPTKEPWQIKKSMLLVYNTNSSSCMDGSMGLDSDSDGVCDKDELSYGLDPANRFSINAITIDNNSIDVSGYGDYFQWRRIEFGEALVECSDRSDLDHDLLTFCEERHLRNYNPTQCFFNQSLAISGDPLNPDTDLDGILDGIETFMFKDKSSALDCANTNYSYDGEAENAEAQIRQHRNPMYWDPDTFSYDIQIQPIGFDNGSSIFSYEQTRLELFNTLEVKSNNTLNSYDHDNGVNTVLVYYIQTPQNDPNAPGVLKYSIQKLTADQRISDSKGSGAGVDLTKPFSEYRVPASN